MKIYSAVVIMGRCKPDKGVAMDTSTKKLLSDSLELENNGE